MLRSNPFVARPGALLAVIAVGLVGLAMFAVPALAATQPVAGAFTEGPETITSERQSGGNTIITLTRDAFLTGSYTGVGHADQRIVIHADGTFNLTMTINFTGVVCGEPAELEFLVTARGDFNANVLEGSYTVVGPADVGKGHGTLVGEPGVGGTYEGEVHC